MGESPNGQERGAASAAAPEYALLSTEQMYAADKAAISGGVPGVTLMENAGRKVAEAITARWPRADRVAVLCGPGNNGGDGFVVARHLAGAGYRVRLALLGDVARLSGDAAEMAVRWSGVVEPLSPDVLAGADIIVDGLFGAGLARPLDGAALETLEAADRMPAPIIAIDTPSGMEGTGGQILGFAPRAELTVTFFRKKTGHVLMPGRALCGELVVADIGIPGAVLESLGPMACENTPELWRHVLPLAAPGGHKYDRGHAVVMSGPMAATGAARLAARGVLRAGAGLVTVASPREALAVNAAHLTAIMLRECDGAADLAGMLADQRFNVVVLGPGNGVGETTRQRVVAALESTASVVLDADALTSFEADPGGLFAAIRGRSSSVVMTPHEGEFGRLFPQLAVGREFSLNGAPASKAERAARAAAESGAVIVLKGPDTVIAAPSGRLAINTNAPPQLATAGSGDVLAGVVAGLLAQRAPAFEAACAACWLHGAAALAFGPGLIAEDLPEALPGVLAGLMVSGGQV
jgi:NAD(P)H-hydrate epimerase